MDRADHGKLRAGLVTASVARTIMSGSQSSWATLAKTLWADDGSGFAAPTTGARAFGHEFETVGRSLFWERHPEYEIDDPKFVPYADREHGTPDRYHNVVGCSPDFGVMEARHSIFVRVGGGEVKSPTSEDQFNVYAGYTSRNRIPPDHLDQVLFSLWVTGWSRWFFVTHFNGRYAETSISTLDELYGLWLDRFLPKLDAFLKLYLDGVKSPRDKLGAKSLADLLGG